MKKSILIVIPVFNEKENIKELNSRLQNVLEDKSCEAKIIYVDDGSTDESLEYIKEIYQNNKNTSYISFVRNFGQHAAVLAGLKFSKADYVLTLDSDLQNPPEEIYKLIEKTDQDYDIISSKRINRKDNFLRKFCSKIMNVIISKLVNKHQNDYGCMMRMYKKNIVELILKYQEKSIYIPAFATWVSKKIIEVPVEHNSRKMGKNKYSFIKLTRQSLDLITAYTVFPFQLIFIIGILLFAVNSIVFFLSLISNDLTNSINSIISFQIFIIGFIFIILGVLSEYLIRIYKETRKFPNYIIQEISDNLKDVHSKD